MDIRVVRTKKLLRDALLDLLRDKPVEKITPTELCRKATVNRNTFYTHYASPVAVLEEVEDTLVDTVDSAVHTAATPVEAITALCRMLRDNPRLAGALFSKCNSARVAQRVFAVTNRFNLAKMDAQENDLTPHYRQMLSNYTIMGSAAVLEYWVQTGMEEDPAQVAAFIYRVSRQGSAAVTKDKNTPERA